MAPSYVYIEPFEDFYARNPIRIEVIVTDRSEIEVVSIFYRFSGQENFAQRRMQISHQPVIFEVEIPLDEVEAGTLQYYFWARDIYDNQSTWPEGGEDLPMVLPVFPTLPAKKKKKVVTEIATGVEPSRPLENTLPYYLEVDMLSPGPEVNEDEGVPIIVISVYDPEEIVNLESTQIIIDEKDVSKDIFLSADMITYVVLKPFNPGVHLIRYQTQDNAGELFMKDFSFYIQESSKGEEEEKVSWQEKAKFKGDIGWNADYDGSDNRPLDTHKLNSTIKFNLGDYKFKIQGLMSTHIIDTDALEAARF